MWPASAMAAHSGRCRCLEALVLAKTELRGRALDDPKLGAWHPAALNGNKEKTEHGVGSKISE